MQCLIRATLRLIYIIVLIIFSSAIDLLAQSARIVHSPINSVGANENLQIEASVDGANTPILFMRLYFKSSTAQSFSHIPMRKGATGYRAELPTSRISRNQVEYFVMALLANQSVLTYPSFNPYGNPVVVTVTSASGVVEEPQQSQPVFIESESSEVSAEAISSDFPETTDIGDDQTILILSPETGEEFAVEDEVLIAVSFNPEGDPVDVNSVRIFVDKQNVTRNAEITENLLTYAATGWSPGTHRVLVVAESVSGVQLPAASLFVKIKGQKARRITDAYARGRVFAETRQENISNINFSDNIVGGNLSGKYGIAKFNTRLYLTSRETSRLQPRSRFSFNLDLPILGITVGDIYPRFNELMLWGKRVRGVHGRLHFGFFNVDLVYGETIRRVSALRDPVTLAVTQFGTHRQKLLGIRQSWGNGRHFQLGFNMIKVRDDTTSLAAGEFGRTPRDNLTIGSDILFRLARRRIELRGSVAFGLLSTDISGGPLTKKQIEDQFDVNLPFDPADFSDFLIINASTTPLDPRDLTSLAYNVSLRLNYFKNNILFGFKSFGSQYVSLGNPFLRNNLRGFYFNDRMRLFKNKVYFNFRFDFFKDNFDPNNQNPITNLRTINTSLSIYPSRSLPSLTFSVRDYNRDNNVARIDTLLNRATVTDTPVVDFRENNTTRDWSMQLNYDTNFLNLRHHVSASYILSDRNDFFGATRLAGLTNLSETSSNVQLFSVRTQYHFPLITTFNFVRNDNKFAAGTNTFNFKLIGAKAEYLFFGRKLRTYFGLNYTTASGRTALAVPTQSIITDYGRTALIIGTRLEFSRGHFFSIDGQIIRFADGGGTFDTTTNSFTVSNPSFNNRIFRLHYEKRF